jgi:hypothetical protein
MKLLLSRGLTAYCAAAAAHQPRQARLQQEGACRVLLQQHSISTILQNTVGRQAGVEK